MLPELVAQKCKVICRRICIHNIQLDKIQKAAEARRMHHLIPQIEPDVGVDIEQRLIRLAVRGLVLRPASCEARVTVQGADGKIEPRNGGVELSMRGTVEGAPSTGGGLSGC